MALKTSVITTIVNATLFVSAGVLVVSGKAMDVENAGWTMAAAPTVPAAPSQQRPAVSAPQLPQVAGVPSAAGPPAVDADPPARKVDAFVPPVRRMAPPTAPADVTAVSTRRVKTTEIVAPLPAAGLPKKAKPLDTSSRSSLGAGVSCAPGTKLDAQTQRCTRAGKPRN